jgi:hypothetical protein
MSASDVSTVCRQATITIIRINHNYSSILDVVNTAFAFFAAMAKSSPSRLPYTSKTKEHPVSLSSLYSRVQNGSIRVVKTRGFDQNGLLECDLSIQELNREPYTAVSYTWDPDTSIWYGSPTVQTKPIKLNNCIVSIRHKVADILCLMQYTQSFRSSS